MKVQAARPVGIVSSVCLRTSDAIGEVVVALVWDVVDPAARAVDTALRVLDGRSGARRPDRRPPSRP